MDGMCGRTHHMYVFVCVFLGEQEAGLPFAFDVVTAARTYSLQANSEVR